jgi:lysophospholipase L1-like esterase
MPSFPYAKLMQTRSASKAVLSIVQLFLFLLLFTSCSSAGTSAAPPCKSSACGQRTQDKLTYVAIGASDTFGLGTDDPYTQNWASDLAVELGHRFRLVNLGIPGAVMHSALGLELPVALDAHPDLVTIWLGVNDIADNVRVSSYARDLDRLLSRLQAGMPHVRIAIANIPDITLLPHFRSYDPQVLHTRISNYNAVIAAKVKRHHIILVDLAGYNNVIKNHPEYISRDGFHPNDLGYLQLAEVFYQALQRAHAIA